MGLFYGAPSLGAHLRVQIPLRAGHSDHSHGFRPGRRYALWVAKGREVKCAVADKALDNCKARIRQLTRRSGGRSMEQVVEKWRPYLLGWKAYFGLAQTPRVWREPDEWLRQCN